MRKQRRFGRSRVFRPLWGGLLILLLVAYRAYYSEPDPAPVSEAGRYHVRHVIDGDTFVVDGGTKVRLLGVDTPELAHGHGADEPLAAEATEFTRRHVGGQAVRLEFDRERKDQYGRTLAYVYLGEWFLNEELIRAGFSRAQLQYPYSGAIKRRFRLAESAAKEAHAGLWATFEQPPSEKQRREQPRRPAQR